MSKISAAIILALGIALCGAFMSYGITESRKSMRTVQVKGLAERVVKSDQAIWTLQFKLVSNELPKVYQNINLTHKAVNRFLQAQGFPKNVISMSPVTVTDNQSVNYNSNQNLPRYSADGGLKISTPEVDAVTKSMQQTGALVEQGVVLTGSTVQYRFNGLNDIKPEMLTDASDNANEAAQSFATNAKAELGEIRRANQGLFTIRDANSNYDSGNDVMKKVRVVTTVLYSLR